MTELLQQFDAAPLALPPTVLGYGSLVLMGRHGMLSQWLRSHMNYTIILDGLVEPAHAVGASGPQGRKKDSHP
jgi:ABC-type molybdate transport system permease subunit